MNLNFQFQLEDIRKKNEQATKQKNSSKTFIWIGSILLGIGTVFGVLGILAGIGNSLPGSISNYQDATLGLGCCFSLSFLFLIPGIILLGFGIIRLNNAKDELRIIDEENTQLRRQLIIEENKQK
jgi:uncharacterized membrane protein YkgB